MLIIIALKRLSVTKVTIIQCQFTTYAIKVH